MEWVIAVVAAAMLGAMVLGALLGRSPIEPLKEAFQAHIESKDGEIARLVARTKELEGQLRAQGDASAVLVRQASRHGDDPDRLLPSTAATIGGTPAAPGSVVAGPPPGAPAEVGPGHNPLSRS